jgi:hypothetical protein
LPLLAPLTLLQLLLLVLALLLLRLLQPCFMLLAFGKCISSRGHRCCCYSW